MSKENNILKVLKQNGTKVKIASILDWEPIGKLSRDEAELIWVINYSLAVRRIVYMFVTLMTLGVGAGCFLLRAMSIFALLPLDPFILGVGIALSIAGAVMTFLSDNWNKQLAGYRTLCKFHKLPSFGVFGYIMYYIARLVAFCFYIVWFVIIILISMAAKSNDTGFITPYNKLGLPETNGYDDLIEIGTLYEKKVQAASEATLKKFGVEFDHSVNKLQIKTDYNNIKSSLESVNKEIAELEKVDYELLTDKEKDKLKDLKLQAEKSLQLLDEKYNDQSDYKDVRDAFEAIDKKLGKMTGDDYILSDDEKRKLNVIKDNNETAQNKLEGSYNAKKDALQQSHDEKIADIDSEYNSKVAELNAKFNDHN